MLLALPQPLGKAARLPQHSHLSRGKGRAQLTVPKPQTSPCLVFKVPYSSGHTTAKLACDGSANRFRYPKIIHPCHFRFLF